MNFKPKRTSSTPLFKSTGILKLADFITLQNCMFAYDSVNRNLPNPLLDDRINFVNTGGNTMCERLNQLENFRTNTITYGTKSIKSKAVSAWNKINVKLHNLKLQNKSKSICKIKITELLLDNY